ncbi:MAG: fumarylacetoacetate hydrolase family protein [Sedimentisphaerales bacterium]|nr:fumarylacetoacetate hydrolase family protein [Sedimentisphaerales bacterium]
MKIARIIDDRGRTLYVARQSSGSLVRLDNESLLSPLLITNEVVMARRWLPPGEPRTIICVGLNYAQHVREGWGEVPAEPVLFMKNPCAAIGHQEPIRIPAVCADEVDYEGELAVVIGRACLNVSKDEALDYVLGYTIGNDVSARIWQKQRGGGQWCRGKGFDTFAPLGPFLVTPQEIEDVQNLAIKTELNGQIVQQGNTSEMIFDVRTLIHFISQDTTLLPGTIILTGTPEGIGWAREPKLLLRPGDNVSVEIEGLGRLVNPVV